MDGFLHTRRAGRIHFLEGGWGEIESLKVANKKEQWKQVSVFQSKSASIISIRFDQSPQACSASSPSFFIWKEVCRIPDREDTFLGRGREIESLKDGKQKGTMACMNNKRKAWSKSPSLFTLAKKKHWKRCRAVFFFCVEQIACKFNKLE